MKDQKEWPNSVNEAFQLISKRIRSLFVEEIPTHEATLFEYFFDAQKQGWISWKRLVPKYQHNPERKFYEILVPTIDTCRSDWLLQLCYRIKRPVLFVGESGTSKTATITSFLRKLNPDQNVRERDLSRC